MPNIVDVGFSFNVQGNDLNKLIKELDDLKKKSTIEIKLNNKNVVKQTEELKKQEKLSIQMMKMEQQMIDARKNGWKNSQRLIETYSGQLKKGVTLNQEQLQLLRLMNKEDKINVDVINKKKMQQLQEEAKKLAKIKEQKEIANKLEIQSLQLETKMLNSKRTNMQGSLSMIEKYQQKTKEGYLLSKKETEELRKQIELDKTELTIETEILKKEKEATKEAEKQNKINSKNNKMNLDRNLDSLKKYVRMMSDFANEARQMDVSLYNLGAVSGQTGVQIEGLRYKILDMSTDTTIAFEDIAEATAMIVKTGRDLDEAMGIVNSGLELAVATGEDLYSVTDALSKILVSFRINGSKAGEVINQFYSTAVQTPTSINQIAQALRNSSSAFATLIEFTSLSGRELEEYKSELLELNTAMVGSLANVG